ncbi:MAG: hypothetical protein WDM90_13560 [Ferruginibacter sp.]
MRLKKLAFAHAISPLRIRKVSCSLRRDVARLKTALRKTQLVFNAPYLRAEKMEKIMFDNSES